MKLKSIIAGIFLALSEKAKWSSLSRIGNSYIVKMTIVAPFVGSLIIFNNNVIDLLDFSGVFLRNIGISAGDGSISSYSLEKLYFLYFGLFLIGFGSIIYSIFCPENISKFPNSDDFSRSRIGLNSPTVCISSFEDVAEAYARRCGNLSWHKENWRDSLSYSPKLDALTYSLLTRVLGASPDFNEDEEAPDHVAPRTDLNDDQDLSIEQTYGDCTNGYMQANGYINTCEMAKDMVSSPRIMWGYTIPIKETSFSFQADVYHLQYMVDDLSSPLPRLVCFGVYIMGFVILFIPSLETFIRILGRALNIT